MKKLLLIILMILILAYFLISANYTKTINKSFKIDISAKITLKNINGNITIKTIPGNSVKIEAVKSSGKKDELDRVKINFDNDREGLNIYPSGYKNRTSTSISYELIVPEKLAGIKIKNVNGAIRGVGIYKDLEARTVNGTIKFSAMMNNCSLATVNGGISIYQEGAFLGDISVKSVNGSIIIELDKDSSVSLKGGTLNGKIKSDFPLKITKGFIGSSFQGNIKDGKQMVKIKTVNGSISIFKK